MYRFSSIAFVALVVALCASPLAAQTRPTSIEFTASPDHASALVSSYALEMSDVATGALAFPRKDLGKPTPDGTGRVGPLSIAEFASLPAGTFQSPKSYVAIVVAIGPGGEAKSDASVPFPVAAPPSPPRKTGLPVVK